MLSEAEARVTLLPSGRALVETDMTDIGTGTYAILGQIAAEMLGLPLDAVEVRLGDTDLPPAPAPAAPGVRRPAARRCFSPARSCADVSARRWAARRTNSH